MKKSCSKHAPTHDDIRKAARLLKALAEENRLMILLFLKGGEKCVCEIVRELDLPQNLISHHLKALKDTGFITARKEGLRIYYSLIDNTIEKNQLLHTLLLQ